MAKIAIVSMVRNEADVIESFVRHNLQVADALYIIDHASTDGTGEILQQLAAEGLPLVVQRYDGIAQLQAELLTALMAQAFADGAALVLPLDADEFIWPAAGGSLQPVRTALQALDTAQVYSWSWVRCRLTQPEQAQDRLLPARPAQRAAVPEQLGKVIIGRKAWEETHCQLAQGNHHAVIMGESGPARLVPVSITGVFLAHFPWRSQQQAAAKAALGWLANVAKYSRQTTKANHWQADFDRLCTGEPLADPLATAPTGPLPAVKYESYAIGKASGRVSPATAQQDAAAPGKGMRTSLRYPAGAAASLLSRVLRQAEELAEAYREEQVLREHHPVSIILPYTGEPEAFARSLASILQEGYPYAELLVLPLADDAFAAQLPAYLGAQGTAMTISILEGKTQAARFADLQATAQGEYIQWVWPGDTLVPGKLIRMLCALVSDGTLTFAYSNAQDGAAGFSLPLTAGFMIGSGSDIAAALQQTGQGLAGGLTAALFRRADMARWHWLAPYIRGTQLQAAALWQAILPGTCLGVLRAPQVTVQS